MSSILQRCAALALAMGCAFGAQAEVVIGVDVSTTGPAAAIGIQTNNAIRLWPATLGGQPARYVVLDDGTDVSRAVKNMRKLTSEDKVDAIVGPNTTAAALAGLDVLAETGTPMVALAASAVIVEPLSDPKRAWAFKMPQNDSLMASVLAQDMKKKGLKTVAFIGFADSYGDSWWKEFSAAAQAAGLNIVAQERFQRTDASVMGQALKTLAAKPDAVLIAGAGTPSALPQKTLLERGYKGAIYQTHGIGTLEFLQVGGRDVEGTLFPTGPGVVARELPDGNPVKKVAVAFADKYEAQHGAHSLTQFAGDAYGAWMLLDSAVGRALKTGAKPGTPEFRRALRDALENTRGLVVPNGVLNVTAQDHQGFDERARVMGVIKDGKFSYAGQP
ncbi:ABC transporter substrate-binding protein [Bordetella pseudohinzii]|uniref:Branched-chain amino acid ABC transporter substrate-binding protein n=1 Tax=Bordetella pseudohinzii TaxID=1331258 RepID=A0A0J6C9X5_9BORD|nr:ABC transporter substrate-binding protein [Bordetella pseudohinzii]ANY16672.1 branched-chain amino acid ABC transporter substrate-binding protein [Bordetella pseudohinzii]KMM27838.1 branched-chain amino acid ABC transporter substrate-binding protein [Bordetella pseudohinzii]KXA77616.1 branched-chain amino acid ABC transporter substrate-binding protein [Bordetella pseudohinzii]KXA81976.1 branched-chain amino acid ABC transporter substrate-binding protein [Bordetella pseudohinzii]CUI29097.1 R